MIDELDYGLLPEEAWFKLVSWYGMTSDQQVLQRKVVVHGTYVKSLKVEVYLMEFQLSQHSDPETLVTRQFSKGDTIGELWHAREICRQRSTTALYECESWSEEPATWYCSNYARTEYLYVALFIQHIVILPKYGYGAPKICPPYSTDHIMCLGEKWQNKDHLQLFCNKLYLGINVLNNKTIILLNLADYPLICRRHRWLSVRRYSSRFRWIIVNYSSRVLLV